MMALNEMDRIKKIEQEHLLCELPIQRVLARKIFYKINPYG